MEVMVITREEDVVVDTVEVEDGDGGYGDYEYGGDMNIPIAFYSKHIEGTTNDSNANATVKLRSDASDVTWEVKMDGRRLTQGWEKFATGHAFKIILMNEDGKPWTLFLKYYDTSGHVYIRRGWRSFYQANRKRAKDVLTFKLVKTGTKPVLQLRAYSVYNRRSSSSSSISQDRFVTLTLRPYNLKNSKLCLPVLFVKANGIKNAREITLIDRYGVKRTTSLKPDDKYGRVRLGKECIKFCEVKSL
ncbi:hypothetical protein YC2023_038495 [Brassica napus]